MTEETRWTEDGREWRLRIEQDELGHGDNGPREWVNLGTMVCWHSRYELGDEQPSMAPNDWLEEFNEEYPHATILPLYLYDHSGITMSTGAFSCPWDSGQVGWIYLTPERAAEECPNATPDELVTYLRNEVETYDQFLTGDVWGYVLESRPVDPCATCGHEHDWHLEDSCWGFYGHDLHENGIGDHVGEDVLARIA